MSGLELALVLVPVIALIIAFPLGMLVLTSMNTAPKVFANDAEVVGMTGAYPELRTRPPLRAARLLRQHRHRHIYIWLAHVEGFQLPGVRNVRIDRFMGPFRATSLRKPWTDEELSHCVTISGPDAAAMRALFGLRRVRDALRGNPCVEWFRIEVSPIGHVTLRLTLENGSPAVMKRTLLEVVRMVEALEAAAKSGPG